MERAVRVGDWIVVGADRRTPVRRINVRSTEIETFDRAQVIIPNSNLVTGVVTNLVRNDRTGRVVIPLTVAAGADPERVREVLIALAKANPARFDHSGPANPVYRKCPPARSTSICASSSVTWRPASVLKATLTLRFLNGSGRRFFDAPAAATKVEIVHFENRANQAEPIEEFPAGANEPKRGAPGR